MKSALCWDGWNSGRTSHRSPRLAVVILVLVRGLSYVPTGVGALDLAGRRPRTRLLVGNPAPWGGKRFSSIMVQIGLDDGAVVLVLAGSFVPPPSCSPLTTFQVTLRCERLSGHGSHTVPPGSQMLHPCGFDARQGHPCTRPPCNWICHGLHVVVSPLLLGPVGWASTPGPPNLKCCPRAPCVMSGVPLRTNVVL